MNEDVLVDYQQAEVRRHPPTRTASCGATADAGAQAADLCRGKVLKIKGGRGLSGLVGPLNFKKYLKDPTEGRKKTRQTRIARISTNFREGIFNRSAGGQNQTQMDADGGWIHTGVAEDTEEGLFARNFEFIRLNPTESDRSFFSKPIESHEFDPQGKFCLVVAEEGAFGGSKVWLHPKAVSMPAPAFAGHRSPNSPGADRSVGIENQASKGQRYTKKDQSNFLFPFARYGGCGKIISCRQNES